MTPLPLVRAIEGRIGVRIGDDVAADVDACVCRRLERMSAWWSTKMDQAHIRRPGWDALAHEWDWASQGEAVWCNPPYSTAGQWLAKCAQEGQQRPVVALVPARTDTAAWHDHVMPRAKVILLLRGRVEFILPEDLIAERLAAGLSLPVGSTFPSAVILWHPGQYRGCIIDAWDWRADVAMQQAANDNRKDTDDVPADR